MLWTAAVTGFFSGAGLIVAIGAQNAFVLRQGLQRQHAGLVVLVCALSDIVLIVCGVAGMGALVLRWPQLLQVLRGVQESLADGKGLFHRSSNASAVIKFEHRLEPVPGYLLDVSKKPLAGDLQRVSFFFRPAEAFACALMLEQALVYVAFGIPTVIPRMRPATVVPVAEMPVAQAVGA